MPMGRLAATSDPSAGPAGLTVKKDANAVINNAKLTPEQLYWLRWKEAGAHGGRGMGAVIAAKRAAADAQFRQDDYPAWYAKETAVNGCSVPVFSSYWEGQRQICNGHDVGYGRGGGEWNRLKADTKLGYEILRQGRPGKAVVTFVGVRVGGIFFYNYRWSQLNTPAEEAEERKAEEARKKKEEEYRQQAKAAAIQSALIGASPRGSGQARINLYREGITDPAEQDKLLQDYFNRDKTDMK